VATPNIVHETPSIDHQYLGWGGKPFSDQVSYVLKTSKSLLYSHRTIRLW